MMKAGVEQFAITSINLLILFGISMELLEEWKELIIVPIYMKGDKREDSNYTGISLLPTKDEIISNILQSNLTPYTEEIISDHQSGFQKQQVKYHSEFIKYLRKNGDTVKQYISS
jgi:hypothetical protein